MLSLFKRRNWKPDVVPELRGSHDGLNVVVRNLPCLLDPSDGKRKYPYSDFGAEFLGELTDGQLRDFEHIHQVLSSGGGKTVAVTLRDHSPIEVAISGRASEHRKTFYSDLADALISAFESHGIKP